MRVCVCSMAGTPACKSCMATWQGDMQTGNDSFEFPVTNSQGWICPKCGYSWAQWLAGCMNCNKPQTQTISTTDDDITPECDNCGMHHLGKCLVKKREED